MKKLGKTLMLLLAAAIAGTMLCDVSFADQGRTIASASYEHQSGTATQPEYNADNNEDDDYVASSYVHFALDTNRIDYKSTMQVGVKLLYSGLEVGKKYMAEITAVDRTTEMVLSSTKESFEFKPALADGSISFKKTLDAADVSAHPYLTFYVTIYEDGVMFAQHADTNDNSLALYVRNAPQANPFMDVEQSDYYYDAIIWAVHHIPQITNGTSSTRFSPSSACTRGQVVTFLWRAAGCPEPKTATTKFTDVKDSSYYSKAVRWAGEKGITKGVNKTTFAPNAPCTRAEIVTFIWRASGSPQADNSVQFVDIENKAYYETAVRWAVAERITKGVSSTEFAPKGICTRGQIVTFLYRANKETEE